MGSPSDVVGTRFFVTGAHGFIGQNVVRLLAEQGAEVVGAYRSRRDMLPALPGRQVQVDLRDTPAVIGAMDGSRVVIHMAARSGGIQFQEGSHLDVFLENQAISNSVFAAAATVGVSRVFVSSSAVVYRGGHEQPIPETAPEVTLRDQPSGYAWAKVCDELVGAWWQEAGAFEVVVGRFTNVYGPGATARPEHSTVVHDLIRKALVAGSDGTFEVWGDGSAVRSFIMVDDAARAVVAIVLHGQNSQGYNIDSSEPVSIRDLAEQIRDLVDPSISLAFKGEMPSGDPYRVLDSSKIRALGFEPSASLADGLEITIRAISSTTSASRARK